jgi:hypothetical protein
MVSMSAGGFKSLHGLFSELSWRPTIGDPSFMGWFTVVAYGFGVALAVLASSRSAASNDKIHRREKWVWLGVAGVMAILCVNKQLDLQSLLTDIGRVLSRQQGWYEQRRGFQRLFVVGVLAASVGFGCWSIWRFREFWNSHKLLAGGMLFLLTFIAVRAISFHHFDVVISTRVLGVRMNWVFELTGIFLVSLAAARRAIGGDQAH